MNKPYKVTLAMPIYNVEKYVEQALLSALNQTFDSIEYILIDDRGTDNSMDIVNTIVKNHSRGDDVRIIVHKENIGTGGTKNTAIDNAQGEFIFFMDSDDEITPDCIRILYEKMQENQVDFVAASYNYIPLDRNNRNGEVDKKSYNYKDLLIKPLQYSIANIVFLDNVKIHIPLWNKLYKIKFLRENGIRCMDNHLNEDNYFTFQVFLKAQSCMLLSKITYYYYERSTSTMYNLRTAFSLRSAKEHEETARLRLSYLQAYRNYPFYFIAQIHNYYFALNFAYLIYKSKNISIFEKNNYIKKMLKYPISIKELMREKHKIFHFLVIVMHSIPFVLIKIILLQIFFRFYIKMGKIAIGMRKKLWINNHESYTFFHCLFY